MDFTCKFCGSHNYKQYGTEIICKTCKERYDKRGDFKCLKCGTTAYTKYGFIIVCNFCKERYHRTDEEIWK